MLENLFKNRTILLLFLVAATVHTSHESRFGAWGIDLSGMNQSINPGDDFYGYVNQKWAQSNQIPPDKSSYGSFNIVDDLSEERVRDIVEFWSENNALNTLSEEGKVANLYRSFMDEEAINQLHITPLQTYLDVINLLNSKEDMARFMGQSFAGFGQSFFAIGISIDAKNTSAYTTYLSQAGLNLPDRDYYIFERYVQQKKEYKKYIQTILEIINWQSADVYAKNILDLETKIAFVHWTRAESRQREKIYNPTTPQELLSTAPGFPWDIFFKEAGIPQDQRIIARQNTAFPQLAQIFSDTPLDILKAWQAFNVINEAAPYLSHDINHAHWYFFGHILRGEEEQRPRWKRGVNLCESILGEVIGKEYVARHFSEDAKEKMETLVTNLLKAMGQRIKNVSWMSDATKERALQKLGLMSYKIGYPSKWKDYSELEIYPSNLIGSIVHSKIFEWAHEIDKLNKPVDKDAWTMTPQTVNAYYSPTLNQIVFPAAILEAPFFNQKADMAVNYGSIGAVIGHEITHAFDDQGRKSNGFGELENWWTPDDAQNFEHRANKLGEQYEAIDIPDVDGARINAKLTMGENIGDLGGILVALDAYKLSEESKSLAIIDGFSNEQRFFLGYAQVWRTLQRPEAMKQQLASDPHSPGHIRAYAPLRNIDAWYEAFKVQPTDGHYLAPENRIRIW